MITYNKNKFFELKLKVNTIPEELNLTRKRIDTIILKSVNVKTKNKNNWRKPRPKIIKAFDCKEEGIINSNLNKLSPKNFEKISQNLLEILKNNGDILSMCIENIFKKAVSQPTYCEQYIKLIKLFIDNNYDVSDILHDKCQMFTDLLKYKMSDGVESDFDYDEFCETIKEKSYKNGFSKFIGELANYSLIDNAFININIDLFITNLEDKLRENPKHEFVEDNILCLYKLLITCKDKVDNMETIIEKIEEFKNCGLIKRLEFKLLDLLDELKSSNNI